MAFGGQVAVRAAELPETEFAANLPKWRAAIDSGRKSADDIIAMVSTRGVLSDEQKRLIREAAPTKAEGDAA